MKAVKIFAPEKVILEDIPVPELKENEVLLKVDYVGFCGSDLSTYLGRNPMVSYPRIPGHEISATIIKTGSEVPDSFKKGDRVTVIPYSHCGHCSSCKKGRFNACENNQTLGVQRDGAMSEYFTAPFEKLLITNELSARETALIEPLTVGFHAVNRAKATSENIVMVLGCGMIGAGAIAGAAARGSTVVAVDIDDQKLQIAKKIGAKFVVNTRKKELGQALKELLNNDAPDVVIEAAGNPITYRAGIEHVAFSGKMVCIGYAKEEISFSTKWWVQKELDILGSRNATLEDFKNVMQLLKHKAFPTEEVITRVVDPETAPEAFVQWAKDPGKTFKILVRF